MYDIIFHFKKTSFANLAFYTQRRKQDLYSSQAYSAYSGIGVIYSGICTTYVLIICLVHWLSISYKYLTQYTWYKYNNTIQFAPYVKMSVPVSVTAFIFTRLRMKTKLPWRALREGIVICVMCAECSAPSDSSYHTCVSPVWEM